MKKKNLILGLLLGLGLAFFVPQQASAASWCSSAYGYSVSGVDNVYQQGQISGLDLAVHNVINNGTYQLALRPGVLRGVRDIGSPKNANGTTVSFSTSDPEAITATKGNYKTLFLKWNDGGTNYECKLAEYEIQGSAGSCSISASQDSYDNPTCFDHESPITIKISNAVWEGSAYNGYIILDYGGTNEATVNISGGNGEYKINAPSTMGTPEAMRITVTKSPSFNAVMCVKSFSRVQKVCTDEQREEVPEDKPFEICNQIPESGPKDKCLDCFSKDGIWTAIGCIETGTTEGIVGKLMTVGISIAGGIALLMILAAAFLFATSEGEPKRTSEAKEILTSAIVGLIFIIFSVTILQFIGINILKIPGFGE